MYRTLYVLSLLLPLCALSQKDNNKIRTRSHQTIIYKVSAATAERFIREERINLNDLADQPPYKVANKDKDGRHLLPNGNYIFVSVEDNELIVGLQSITNLYVYAVNNHNRVQLAIIDKSGQPIENAKVWVNEKASRYNKSAKTYWVPSKKPEDAKVKVYTESDTLYADLWGMDELDRSILRQRWDNFKRSKFVRIVRFVPATVAWWFKPKPYKIAGTTGMMVFSQPKYKQTDTVKLKAYLYNKYRKLYKGNVDVFLEYYSRGDDHSVFLKQLAPSTPGSFVFQIPLADTLQANTNYNVVFKNKKGQSLLRRAFTLEDYLLDDISTYSFRSDKTTYYPNDTIHFYASAKDANGLSILDANTTLLLKVQNIRHFYKDSVYVPDTFFVQKKSLAAEGDTKFDFPIKNAAYEVDVLATLQFKNSNNEIQRKEVSVSLASSKTELTSDMENDSIVTIYRENGEIKPALGLMVKDDNWGDTVKVSYPFKVKVDPMAGSYTFYLVENGKIVDSASPDFDDYNIYLEQVNFGDTLGFKLHNPFAIPVHFSVFDGNKLIGSGQSHDEVVEWKLPSANIHRFYRVIWQYRWEGEEVVKRERIAIYHKFLNIDVKNTANVFPGQKDTIRVSVRNFRNKSAENVNLTAFAYNTQFANAINVPLPPYMAKYKLRPSIERDAYEEYNSLIAFDKLSLGHFPDWQKKFGLDTMTYYKMLFPENGLMKIATPISDFRPQVSVHAVQNGLWQHIHLLYVNNRFVYYSGVTNKMRNVYAGGPGYNKLAIRLSDRLIEVDSLYLQPFYKHDLYIDIDNLPKNARSLPATPFISDYEKSLLERSLLRIDGPGHGKEAYLWQHERLVHLTENTTSLIGPFTENDSLHYFSPGQFDIHFKFEPGYQYNLSKKIARLEKRPIFNANESKQKLPESVGTWRIGDTLPDIPVIHYPEVAVRPFFVLSPGRIREENQGKLFFTVRENSEVRYIFLYPADDPDNRIVFNGDKRVIDAIAPGDYTLLLLDNSWKTLEVSKFTIEANKTLCLRTDSLEFEPGNSLIWKWRREAEEPTEQPVVENNPYVPTYKEVDTSSPLFGNETLSGTIVDRDGTLPVVGAMVIIKGTNIGTSTDVQGKFEIRNIKAGEYILVVASIGYQTKEVAATILGFQTSVGQVLLKADESNLQEVVVTGLGITKKRNLTATFNVQSSQLPLTALEGKVAGVFIQRPGSASQIILRGASSVAGNPPLYIVDGILYDRLPSNISEEMMSTVEVLNEAAATALYGTRGMNGAILITTNNNTGIRKRFRDYAFWQPEIFTDENGSAKFVVEYPDNITGWQMFVLAMDRKRRIGKASVFVKSYKPIWAELNLPRFLVENDSTEIVGKSVNYTKDSYFITSMFKINGTTAGEKQFTIRANESFIRKYSLLAPASDTLDASFHIASNTGFKDGEMHLIPVFKKGVKQTDGKFWILNKDTTVHFEAIGSTESIECYAQNNTLDLMLNEIEQLQNYPYACNEQIASKLTGLAGERKIKEAMKQKFTRESTINLLLLKLLKAQQYDGGWSWWESGKPNLYITNYVVSALLPFRSAPNVQLSIRNGLLYLQNQLPHLRSDELLPALVTMSRAKHAMDYRSMLEKIHFDSLDIHQQWQWILISQNANLTYSEQLKKANGKANKEILGGLHWGDENYRWYSNVVATTVLAFEVLSNKKNEDEKLGGIVQYFISRRRNGYWQNTVESASIVSTILPYVLEKNSAFNQPSTLKISGDTTFNVSKFPFKTSIKNPSIRNLSIQKAGGGLTYFTIFQNHWNSNPDEVSEHFKVRTHFTRNGKDVNTLVSGEKITMIVDIDAAKEGEYVMIEIPIPAGSVYAKQETGFGGIHRELLKDRLVMFTEKMRMGNTHFEIELESRYNGTFTLNPAKVSLMYFPTFYGRNEMRKVIIADEK